MSIDKNPMRSKILFRDRVKAWRGEMLLSSLWVFKTLTWLPMLRNAYRSLLIHLIKRTELFDRAFYLDTHGDAVHSGMSPLRHYVTYGDREGRAPMAFFDPDYYRSRTNGRAKYVNTLLHYAHVGRYRRISPSPWFDVDFYLALNKDVARAGFDPLHHYLKWGGVEGRSPSPEFDGSYYLRTNPSVTQSRLNPLLHYLQIGRFEGRRTVPEENRAILMPVPGMLSKRACRVKRRGPRSNPAQASNVPRWMSWCRSTREEPRPCAVCTAFWPLRAPLPSNWW